MTYTAQGLTAVTNRSDTVHWLISTSLYVLYSTHHLYTTLHKTLNINDFRAFADHVQTKSVFKGTECSIRFLSQPFPQCMNYPHFQVSREKRGETSL